MTVRLVQVAGSPDTALPALVQAAGDRPVIIVAYRRPAHNHPNLAPSEQVWFLDSTGHGPAGLAFTQFIHYVPSPVQLEKTMLVLDRVRRTLPGALAILDDLGTIAQFNDDGPTAEFVHLLANRARARKEDLDLIFMDDERGHRIAKQVRHSVDEDLILGGSNE